MVILDLDSLVMNDFTKEELQGLFKNTHDDQACAVLKAYDAQCDYPDGSPKPVKYRKTMSYYEELSGIPIHELKKHWRCIENE